MKGKLYTLVIAIFLFINLMLLSNISMAQTSGNMSITYTQSPVTSAATKNVLAIWIEDANGTFVKTRARYWGNGTNDHLPSWVSNSNHNTVDAITGATLRSTTNPTAFGVKTITWDGTNTNNVVVPDGVYKVLIESSYCKPEPADNTHQFISTFTFTKGPNAETLTPTDSHLSAISISWTPSTTSINSKDKTACQLSVFPNPSTGIFNLNFNQPIDLAKIEIFSITGQLVYLEQNSEKVNQSKSLDLSALRNGIYMLDINTADGNSIISKIIINK